MWEFKEITCCGFSWFIYLEKVEKKLKIAKNSLVPHLKTSFEYIHLFFFHILWPEESQRASSPIYQMCMKWKNWLSICTYPVKRALKMNFLLQSLTKQGIKSLLYIFHLTHFRSIIYIYIYTQIQVRVIIITQIRRHKREKKRQNAYFWVFIDIVWENRPITISSSSPN